MDPAPDRGTKKNRRRTVLAVVAVVLAGFAVFAFLQWFAPEASRTVAQDTAAATQDATPLASGTWSGDAGHHVSGRLGLWSGSDGSAFLIFEDYDQTAGPDVYLYLSSDPDGDYRAGTVWKVLVPGGAGDGRSTLEGDFQVPVPADVSLDQVASAIVWCDDFAVPFGHAVLA